MIRTSKLLLQAGVIAAVLVALPYKIFELDRYFVPKELVLHAAALIVAIILLLRRRVLTIDAADALFALFLVWSAASALFATNHWLAQRALAVSVSSAVIFWAARKISAEGSHRPLLVAVAIAAVCAGLTALAQAYGVESEYFTLNRAPGGTLGNRNFIAHIIAIGLPALAWCTVSARTPLAALAGSVGTAVAAAALVLSRSRAAWLAVAASVVIAGLPLLASRRYWGGAHVGGRLARLLLAALLGGGAATVIPNRLNWNSDSPYLDSARGMVDYSKGSGRGRLAQYENSMRMAAANPVFGVGPGNWPVRYVKFAPPNDRSLADDGMTANPWPSSDWVGFVSERGFVPAAAVLGVFVVLFFGAFRGWKFFADRDAVLLKIALIATIVATLVVSVFDVALLLAAPAFLVWTAIGAAAGAGRAGGEITLPSRTWTLSAFAATLILLAGAARSATQLMAMTTVAQGTRTANWVRAAAWDPGSYRINVRVAELYSNRGRCDVGRKYARRAVSLFPNSSAARRVSKRCP